jgi:hypothetical protein
MLVMAMDCVRVRLRVRLRLSGSREATRQKFFTVLVEIPNGVKLAETLKRRWCDGRYTMGPLLLLVPKELLRQLRHLV